MIGDDDMMGEVSFPIFVNALIELLWQMEMSPIGRDLVLFSTSESFLPCIVIQVNSRKAFPPLS